MKRITDRTFKYVPAHSTDVRKTFERIRKEQKANAEERQEKLRQLRKTA